MADNDDSVLSVLGERSLESLLTSAETVKIQSKLWALLAGRAESYTMGGSSSVRSETAQELLRSAGFVLRCGIGTDAGPEAVTEQLLQGDFDDLFRAGLRELEARIARGRALLETANKTAAAVDNRAYKSTLRELGVFFTRYHIHHFAHEIPCMLDYPLCHPVDEALLGVDYINEYLRRLLIENEFCGRFGAETVTRLLKAAAPDYREDLLSIYETVAANALALTLLGGDIRTLDMTDLDRQRLAALAGPWPGALVAEKLQAAAAGLAAILELGEGAARDYLAATARALSVRLRPALAPGRLEHVFPTLYIQKEAPRPANTYTDGALMDDEKLRALIDTLTSCRHVADKIALIRRHVFSLRDLSEVLGVCFWDEELDALLDALGPEALEQLRRFAARRQSNFPEWRSETGWENKIGEYRRQ